MYNECTSQGYMVSPFPSPLSCGHYDASGVLRTAAAALRKGRPPLPPPPLSCRARCRGHI